MRFSYHIKVNTQKVPSCFLKPYLRPALFPPRFLLLPPDFFEANLVSTTVGVWLNRMPAKTILKNHYLQHGLCWIDISLMCTGHYINVILNALHYHVLQSISRFMFCCQHLTHVYCTVRKWWLSMLLLTHTVITKR